MIRLGVVYAQYDQARYGSSFPVLMRCLERLAVEHFTVVRVDNRAEGDWVRHVGANVLEIGGDNRVYEFSAWMKGLDALHDEAGTCDLYLFVTDAFLAYGDDYPSLMSPDLAPFLLAQAAVAGIVDAPPGRRQSWRLLDWRIVHWVRTSFYFVPRSVLEATSSLITFHDVDRFCPVTFGDRVFHADAPLSADYQAFIEHWLTRRWHRAFSLSPDTWNRFRLKTRSILNEHALSTRWWASGVPVFDLRWASRARERHGMMLTELPARQLMPYRHDPARQRREIKEPFAKRVALRLQRMFQAG